MNKVYGLAVKDIYNIIFENLMEVSEVIMREEFDKIVPELKNYISDDKLNKISNEIFEEIIKNK